jgi:hypothetical protein
MAKDASRGDTTRNVGTVRSVRSSVVEMRFPERLPEINAMIRAGHGEIPVETITHVDPQTVRGIALTSTEGLAEGAAAVDTGRPLEVPLGDALLGRVFNVFGEVIDGQGDLTAQVRRLIHRTPPRLERQSTKSEIFTTGIKAMLADLTREPWPTRILPMFTMDRQALFSELIQQYLFAFLFRAFADSLASENASRLAAMQGAERNIRDRLGDLTRFYYQQRQMSITGELLDIRVSARNNCTSCLSFGPSPALHSPAHIPICAGECAWVTNQNPAPYCAIIYCRDPYFGIRSTRGRGVVSGHCSGAVVEGRRCRRVGAQNRPVASSAAATPGGNTGRFGIFSSFGRLPLAFSSNGIGRRPGSWAWRPPR